MTGYWDQKGVPHKNWTCVGVEDLETPDGNCEMCGKEEIRYVHYMEHPAYKGTISAGCICAEHMEEDYSTDNQPSKAKMRERSLKNKAGRKKRWLGLKSWKTSKNGNPHISKDGFHITIFKRGSVYKFVIEYTATKQTYFSRGRYETCDAAKLKSFDAMIFFGDQIAAKSKK